MWLTVCTAVVGYVPEGSFKRWLNYKVSIMCFAVLSSALSSVITYNNPENRPVRGICVANHTSPIDILVLMCDNCYSLVCLLVSNISLMWISFYSCFFCTNTIFCFAIIFFWTSFRTLLFCSCIKCLHLNINNLVAFIVALLKCSKIVLFLVFDGI